MLIILMEEEEEIIWWLEEKEEEEGETGTTMEMELKAKEVVVGTM
jgi:hypothetical protein